MFMVEKRCFKVVFGMEDDEYFIDVYYGDLEFFVIYEICEDGSIKFFEKRYNKVKDIEEEYDEGYGDLRKFKVVVS